MQLLLGLLLSALVGLAAYWRGSLSKSGVAGAILTGTIIFGLGGWAWGTLLIVFFVSSSALSHYKEALKESLAEKFSKGHRRDLAQTLANGGAGALIVIANALWPNPAWWAAFVGALATVNADTWATELGVLSKSRPRLVINGKHVEVGTSGGVTLTGALAALGGAMLIAITALMWIDVFRVFWISSLAGLMGSLFDSFLGATVQAMYFCDHCVKETERHPTHTCGNSTRRLRGWRWLDNDWVNFLSSVVGAAVAGGIWMVAR
jgi:uncharacterized protein (TIGR00297 family)